MRLDILQPPYDEESGAILKRWMPDGSKDPLLLFRLLATHPRLMERLRPLGAFQLGKESGLDIRTRELLIDRTCARCGCEYEWGVHAAAFGARAGLTPEEIAGTVGDKAVFSREGDRLLMRLVDELHDTGTVSDSLFVLLAANWSESQILEMLVLIGWYHMVSFVANGAALPPERWATRFPL